MFFTSVHDVWNETMLQVICLRLKPNKKKEKYVNSNDLQERGIPVILMVCIMPLSKMFQKHAIFAFSLRR